MTQTERGLYFSASRRLRRRIGLPPPCPPGWRTGPPDFVGVGTQRSGSSWWYGLVLSHPAVRSVGGKERHFFDRFAEQDFTVEDVTAYHDLFPRPAGAMTGEWTPRYVYDPWTPALLRRATAAVRILVMLRDPLARFRSGLAHEGRVFSHELRRKRARDLRTMIVNDQLRRSLYARQLSRLYEHFDHQQVLVLQYERCVRDTSTELKHTYEFLGLEAGHAPQLPPRPERGRRAPPEVSRQLEMSARVLIADDLRELSRVAPQVDLDLWPSCP